MPASNIEIARGRAFIVRATFPLKKVCSYIELLNITLRKNKFLKTQIKQQRRISTRTKKNKQVVLSRMGRRCKVFIGQLVEV